MRGEARSAKRLEAFSDGVMAIIVTLTVFGLKPPASSDFRDLLGIWPNVASYSVSFAFVAIIWINHHHLVQSARRVDTAALWANMAMLFSMSFIPFASGYLAAHVTSPLPVALYAGLFFLCLLAFNGLSAAISRRRPAGDDLARRKDRAAGRKNAIALGLYLAAIPLAFLSTWLSLVIVVCVSMLFVRPASWPQAGKAPAASPGS